MEDKNFRLESWTTADYDRLCQHLHELADPQYRAFHAGLVPGVENLLGIRIPVLRALAKEIAKGNVLSYTAMVKQASYEEIMLYGLVLGCSKLPLEAVCRELERFIPMIDNWAICDTCCAGLKIAKRYPAELFQWLQTYLRSEKEYELRFGIVMLMDYYIDEAHIDFLLAYFGRVRHEGYYVKMAVAWALSVCFVKFREKTLTFLETAELDLFTYNKALQKMIESDRVKAADKALLRGKKRK